jgi:nucleoside-diphosphate-sugar epimerase
VALEHLGDLATGERFIVADDVPCTQQQFAETATMSCRVTNTKAKRLLGWTPRYPSFREGLQATVAAIERGEVAP